MSDRDEAVRAIAAEARDADMVDNGSYHFLRRCIAILDEHGIEDDRVDVVIEGFRQQMEQEVESSLQELESSLRLYEQL